MSNIEATNELLTAINFDRFAEIEARHQPNVRFASFRGPHLNDSVAVADWHREFLRDYADCNYAGVEYIEQDDTVVVRATIEAKGYDWRAFSQRVVEVLRYYEGAVAERRLYGMLRDVEFDKPTTAAMTAALEYRGGSPSKTREVVQGFLDALAAGNVDEATSYFHEKAVAIDSVYAMAVGAGAIVDLLNALPRPLFGIPRVTNLYAADHTALAEVAIDPTRPRAAHWFRLVDEKIIVLENYWMLREIGVDPYVNYARDRHQRLVILPI